MITFFIFCSLFAYALAETACVGNGNQIAPALPGIPCPPGTVESDDGNCCDPRGVQIVGETTVAPTFSPGVTNVFGTTRAVSVTYRLAWPFIFHRVQVAVNTLYPSSAHPTVSYGVGDSSGVVGGSSGVESCADLINPLTGVSDCAARASLCNDPTYSRIMTAQCPLTCKRCSDIGNTVAGRCADRLNPKTGTSDCPQRVSYCNDPIYYEVMNQECPTTCKRSGCGSQTTF